VRRFITTRSRAALVVGWLLGVSTALAALGVTGGWYEYRVIQGLTRESATRLVNGQTACEPVGEQSSTTSGCPVRES
jgi:hypothetical protein